MQVIGPLGTREGGLVVALGRSMRVLRAHAGTREDPAAAAVLHEVACRAPVRLTDLADRLHLDPSTVSRHVRALRDAGRIAGSDDPADRRATLLSLTPEGRQALESSVASRIGAVAAATADWPDAEFDALVSGLERLVRDLDSQLGTPRRAPGGDPSATPEDSTS